MPFDTVNRLPKRVRLDSSIKSSLDNEDYYSPYTCNDLYALPTTIASNSNGINNNGSGHLHSPPTQGWDKPVQYSALGFQCYQQPAILTPQYTANTPLTSSVYTSDISSTMDYFDTASLDEGIPTAGYYEDAYSVTPSEAEQSSSNASQALLTTPYSPLTADALSLSNYVDTLAKEELCAQPDNGLILSDMLSKLRFSHTASGIKLEAKVTNATDFRSLIDAFSQMCCSSLTNSIVTQSNPRDKSTINKTVLCRNKSNQSKPVNHFDSVCRLGVIANPHSSLETFSDLKQIADACIDTFFECKVRFKPILRRDEFIRWYRIQENPLETAIVNAMCSLVFRHMVIHHPRPGLNHFLRDLDKVQEQEEYFFSCARELLAQSFDTPDRYTVIAMLLMVPRAEPSKRHHYAGMAASAMHQLDIYPRMVYEEPNSYDKELDTRLWWYLWALDFSIWSAGSPKNTPQPKHPGEPDLPMVFEEDIDESEINVITFSHCLELWRIQSDIVSALYDQPNNDMTVEQLYEYDKKLQSFYNNLPSYLVLDSGFEYGCEDLFLSCLRVNIEYNASRIILHKLFIPEMNDTIPNQCAIKSLNICLSTALTQLSVIKTCNMGDVGRCAFDRDELWRAAEIISVANDIYHYCSSLEDRRKILTGIRTDDFKRGLLKSYEVLKNTREFRYSCKNWFQVADWIQAELQRHQFKESSSIHDYHSPDESTKVTQPDYFLAHLKPNATINAQTLKYNLQQPLAHQSNVSTARTSKSSTTSKTLNSRSRQKSLTFQNQFSIHSTPSPAFQQQQQQQQHTTTDTRRPLSSSSTQFMQFNSLANSTNSHQQRQPTSKASARFRYFNPRKMNKFLFIDEHPML